MPIIPPVKGYQNFGILFGLEFEKKTVPIFIWIHDYNQSKVGLRHVKSTGLDK